MMNMVYIEDRKIIKCMNKTHEWYTFSKIIRDEFNINSYQLWIGSIKWGDNDWQDVIAKYHKGYAWFEIGAIEKQVDLVTAIIYSYMADEPVAVNFNNSIFDTVNLLTKFTDTDYTAIFGELLWKTDYDFMNGVVGEGL